MAQLAEFDRHLAHDLDTTARNQPASPRQKAANHRVGNVAHPIPQFKFPRRPQNRAGKRSGDHKGGQGGGEKGLGQSSRDQSCGHIADNHGDNGGGERIGATAQNGQRVEKRNHQSRDNQRNQRGANAKGQIRGQRARKDERGIGNIKNNRDQAHNQASQNIRNHLLRLLRQHTQVSAINHIRMTIVVHDFPFCLGRTGPRITPKSRQLD